MSVTICPPDVFRLCSVRTATALLLCVLQGIAGPFLYGTACDDAVLYHNPASDRTISPAISIPATGGTKEMEAGA